MNICKFIVYLKGKIEIEVMGWTMISDGSAAGQCGAVCCSACLTTEALRHAIEKSENCLNISFLIFYEP